MEVGCSKCRTHGSVSDGVRNARIVVVVTVISNPKFIIMRDVRQAMKVVNVKWQVVVILIGKYGKAIILHVVYVCV